MSSTSFPEELFVWAVSRLAVWRIFLLWLLLSVCIQLISGEFFTASAIVSTLLVATLIIQFRLWDDLTDHTYDAALHPKRVLVNTPYLQNFWLMCATLTFPIAIVLITAASINHLFVYTALLVAMAALYAIGTTALSRLVRVHLVLLKYPVFIWLCAWNSSQVQWLSIVISAYFLLCLFEIMSDSTLRTGTSWHWLAVIETVACVALLIF